MGAAVGDGVVARAGVVGAGCGDRAELPADVEIGGELAEQLGQHRRVTDVAASDLDGADLQRLLVDADVDLAPETAFGATILAGVPFAFGGLTPRHRRDGPAAPRPP